VQEVSTVQGAQEKGYTCGNGGNSIDRRSQVGVESWQGVSAEERVSSTEGVWCDKAVE
jgi:hypothetical protein